MFLLLFWKFFDKNWEFKEILLFFLFLNCENFDWGKVLYDRKGYLWFLGLMELKEELNVGLNEDLNVGLREELNFLKFFL